MLTIELSDERNTNSADLKFLDQNTYSFQQPEFYEKLGYQIFGQLNDFPEGHVKYFMKKSFVFEKDRSQ